MSYFIYLFFQCRVNRSKDSSVQQILGPAREAMLFKHIVLKTNGVSIGPLEYCGNGLVMNKPGGHGEM
jgi:hypothetical protein